MNIFGDLLTSLSHLLSHIPVLSWIGVYGCSVILMVGLVQLLILKGLLNKQYALRTKKDTELVLEPLVAQLNKQYPNKHTKILEEKNRIIKENHLPYTPSRWYYVLNVIEGVLLLFLIFAIYGTKNIATHFLWIPNLSKNVISETPSHFVTFAWILGHPWLLILPVLTTLLVYLQMKKPQNLMQPSQINTMSLISTYAAILIPIFSTTGFFVLTLVVPQAIVLGWLVMDAFLYFAHLRVETKQKVNDKTKQKGTRVWNNDYKYLYYFAFMHHYPFPFSELINNKPEKVIEETKIKLDSFHKNEKNSKMKNAIKENETSKNERNRMMNVKESKSNNVDVVNKNPSSLTNIDNKENAFEKASLPVGKKRITKNSYTPNTSTLNTEKPIQVLVNDKKVLVLPDGQTSKENVPEVKTSGIKTEGSTNTGSKNLVSYKKSKNKKSKKHHK